MLSTDLKINEGAYDSTAGTINTSYDDVHTGIVLRLPAQRLELVSLIL
jgi:hypothetical protein